jgi:LacI family transcriptional regulator
MISEATRSKVLAIAAQIGYSPNPFARALRGKKTSLIGLIIREISDPLFAEFVEVISQEARNLNYQVVLGHAHSDADQALQLSNILDTRHCDGVLVLGDLRNDEKIIKMMTQSNKAVVAICFGKALASIPLINVDNEYGMQSLLDHLYQLGHRNIGFINGGWLGDIKERKDAFINYSKAKELPYSSEYIQTGSNDSSGGYQCMQWFLSLPNRPTAVVASDDVMAIGAIKAVLDAGLSIPKDISITGFDDIPMAKFCYPSLTTVRQPVDVMSKQALEILFDLIEERNIGKIAKIIPELIIRDSTGPVPSE